MEHTTSFGVGFNTSIPWAFNVWQIALILDTVLEFGLQVIVETVAGMPESKVIDTRRLICGVEARAEVGTVVIAPNITRDETSFLIAIFSSLK